MLDERGRSEEITLDFSEHRKESADIIEELRNAVDKEAGARAALSQVIADQQMTLARLKEGNEDPSPPSPTPQPRPAPLVGTGWTKRRSADPPAPMKTEPTDRLPPSKSEEPIKEDVPNQEGGQLLRIVAEPDNSKQKDSSEKQVCVDVKPSPERKQDARLTSRKDVKPLPPQNFNDLFSRERKPGPPTGSRF